MLNGEFTHCRIDEDMRNFFNLGELPTTEVRHLNTLAQHLKLEWQSGGNKPVLAGKTLAMIFQKPSLRTRLSFDIGMKQLGGYAVMLGPTEIGLGERESIADVARVVSGMAQGIMARVFAHEHILELAEWASVPVINGLSDTEHPCQAMADILTIQEHFGYTDGLHLGYIGDGNNVAASLIVACAHFGIDFSIAMPEGYELPQVFYDQALKIRPSMKIRAVARPEEAVEGCDILYTDTWISMGQEDESTLRLQDFQGYQINASLLATTGKNSIVMHDLPAYRGKEITDDVADGPQSVIFQQAANRLHAQKAILVHLLS